MKTRADLYIDCSICGGHEHVALGNTRSAKTLGIITPICICRTCGFVFVNPRWTKAKYDEVLNVWSRTRFESDPQQKIAISDDPNTEQVRFKKWVKMHDRIDPYYPDGVKTLLDIGASQGWCIEYMQKKYQGIESYAVERWPDCRENIKQRYGAKLIGNDAYDNWEVGHEEKFSLVVLRHVLEHMIEPRAVLAKIRAALAKEGMLYVVVPNIKHITRPLFNDYFRPSHLSYFCKETLESLMLQSGLSPVVLEEDGGEVWGLFKRGEYRTVLVDAYTETSRLLLERIRKERLLTARSNARILLMSVLDGLRVLPLVQRSLKWLRKYTPCVCR